MTMSMCAVNIGGIMPCVCCQIGTIFGDSGVICL